MDFDKSFPVLPMQNRKKNDEFRQKFASATLELTLETISMSKMSFDYAYDKLLGSSLQTGSASQVIAQKPEIEVKELVVSCQA